jgi:lysophospholipase L1-like esterase
MGSWTANGVDRGPGRLAAACLVAVLALFALDAAAFRTGVYPFEPDSSSGLFEMILRRELEAQKRYGDNVVVTLGDSRFALSPRLCNELTPRSGLVFRSAGVAGTDARAWYYLLRDLDPDASRYRAVVFGVSDFDDLGDSFNNADDERTLHYVIARLRLADVWDFASSFEDPALRLQAVRGGLLKGFVLARDVRAFLQNPPRRLNYVNLCRRGFEEWTYDFVETDTNMMGLRIDWTTNTAFFPPGMSSDQLGTVNAHLEPQHVDERLARFQRRWFGRIVDRYRGSRTRIVFLRLPRGPIPRPSQPAPPATSSLRELAARPGVVFADPDAFDFLERPELFKDGAHLNREGIARFSPRVVDVVAELLGQAPRP